MTTATIDLFRLSCAQAKNELGILPELRSHVRSHTPGKVAWQSYKLYDISQA